MLEKKRRREREEGLFGFGGEECREGNALLGWGPHSPQPTAGSGLRAHQPVWHRPRGKQRHVLIGWLAA